MGSALAFVLIVVAFGIFMPDVLRALNAFLLALFDRATALVDTLPSAQTAVVSYPLSH